jgi:guanylate kinase
MNHENRLFVVSGPAGVGKDTVVSTMRALHPEIEKTVSATTRAPREGEVDGVSYHFCTVEHFQQLLANDGILEHNFYCGNYYGTLRSEVDSRLAAGKVVVLVIDVHGAANIKRMYPAATTVFICPPSGDELEKRLRGRGTENDESLHRRLAEAKAELAQAPTYDVRLTNVDVPTCAEELYALICARSGE